MENLAWYVYAVFVATVLLAAWLFFKASHYSKFILGLMVAWVSAQSLLAVSGFYSDINSMSNRFPLLVLPPLIFFISHFFTAKGRLFIDSLDIRMLTIFHIVRIPVEIVLFWLFVNKSVPEAVTFEGRNFDISYGLSAPVIYYFAFVKKGIGKTVLIVWNILCIGLLLNVVSNALLSLPARFEHFGFEQPNIAVGYFPFMLLPAFLVPMVLFSNLAAIRQLLGNGNVLG